MSRSARSMFIKRLLETNSQQKPTKRVKCLADHKQGIDDQSSSNINTDDTDSNMVFSLEEKDSCPIVETSSSEEEHGAINSNITHICEGPSNSSEQLTSNLRQLEFENVSNEILDKTSSLENVQLKLSDDGLHSNNDFDQQQDKSKSANSDLRSKNDKSLANDLREWALETNVNHNQLRKLLLKLKCYHPELPKDPRTLLCTERSLNCKTIMSSRGTEGKIKYFGIQSGLEVEFQKGFYSFLKENNKDNIELVLNVDGIPVFKSSSTQFWPICGKIFSEKLNTDVFDIAVYVGDSKPNDLEEYLSDFVSEINILQNEGFFYNNEKFSVTIKAVSCDAPARAYLKCIKSHNSQEGCEFCNIQGKHLNHRIIFSSNPDDIIERRTNESFRNQIHKKHHTGISPLLFVQNLDIVRCFVLDYMHMACLGTMRRFVSRWLKSDSRFCIRPSSRKIASSRMCAITLPKEFNRKMRSFIELDRFKATEYRTLLLYLAPFIFKGLLPSVQYKHFLLLYCAMRICCNKTLLYEYGDKAVLFIQEFIKKSQTIYENEEPIYNTHSLKHMIENAVESGVCLEDINCFPFENHLGQLKKLIRGKSLPLEQVVKRLLEKKYCFKKYEDKCKEIFINPKSKNDKYVLLTNNKIMVVESATFNQEGNTYKGRIYQRTFDVFSNPIQSSFVKVWRVENLGTHLFEIPAKDCIQKCIFIEQNGEYFITAILN